MGKKLVGAQWYLGIPTRRPNRMVERNRRVAKTSASGRLHNDFVTTIWSGHSVHIDKIANRFGLKITDGHFLYFPKKKKNIGMSICCRDNKNIS